MREKLDCALNGGSFNELSPNLYVQDFEEKIKTRTDTANRPHAGTYLIYQDGRDTLEVTVKFMIKERDLAKRQAIIAKVNGWAKYGWLTLNTRPEQKLYVYCTKKADSKTLKWSDDMTLTLTAYDLPYWQDRIPLFASFTGTSGHIDINPLGTRPCLLEAEIKNESGSSVGNVSISCGGKTMAFSGLGLANGKTLKIYYDERRLLHATVDGAGKLSCRTASSHDDIYLTDNQSNRVSLSASGKCTFRIIARGLYD